MDRVLARMAAGGTMKRPVVLACISDTHCGSTIGLVPCGAVPGDENDGVKLPEGGKYVPSHPQRWVWDCWLNFWQLARDMARVHRAELWGAHLGDSREGGSHHPNAVQYISGDSEVEDYIVARALTPMRDAVKRVYICSGTPAHVGPGGDSTTGRWFGTKCQRHPDDDGWAAQEWRLNIHGVRLNLRHHANMGGLPWTRHTAATRLASQVFMEYADHAARTGTPLAHPHIVLRGHQHRFAMSGRSQPTEAIYLPAWQLATAFVNRISQSTLADIGGVLIVIEPNGTYEAQPILYTPDLSAEVTV